MVLPYLSINLLFLALPFMVKQRILFHRLIILLIMQCIIAALIFVLVPLTRHPSPPDYDGIFSALLALKSKTNGELNYFPSLHVSYVLTLCYAFAIKRPLWAKIALSGWGILIICSTVTLYDHYVIDILGGLTIGSAACVFLTRKSLKASPDLAL